MRLRALRGAVLLALGLTGSAQAFQEGVTTQGLRFVSGGVSEEEQASLQARRERYSLWVITAARRTGAYLSDVRVKLFDAREQLVFDAPLDGPWLLIDLPLGRYRMEAQWNGEVHRQTTTIHTGDHHQAVFYFDVDANVVPPSERSAS